MKTNKIFSKLLFLDTETTGLYKSIHEPYQIAMIIEINGKLVEEKVFRLQPTNWDEINQEALEICDITIADLKTYLPTIDVFLEIKKLFAKYVSKFEKTDKFICVGHNVRFDMDMMNQLFKKLGDSYFYSYINSRHELDTLAKAKWLQYEDRLEILTDLKLETLCQYFNISFKAHDAWEDIKATRELFYKLKKLGDTNVT